jgi:glycosyltransferase involved in cell wall biosynthesis
MHTPERWLAVEGLALRSPLTGVGRYTANLLDALLGRYPDLGLDILALGNADIDSDAVLRSGQAQNRIRVHRRIVPTPRLYHLGIACGIAPCVETIFPIVRQAVGIFYPNFVRYPTHLRMPQAVVLYDATLRIFPEDKSRLFRTVWSRLMQRSLDSHATCITISKSAARDIETFFDVRAPLKVIYPGHDPAISDVPLQENKPYVLVIGTDSPRKNVQVVKTAHARLRPEERPRLVIVGQGHGADADVETTGYVNDNHLSEILAGAAVLVAPSHNEGFDLPVIEALTAGVQVFASDIPVHREVLGEDWPHFFAPSDALALASLLEALPQLPATRTPDLQRFQWDASSRSLGNLLGL